MDAEAVVPDYVKTGSDRRGLPGRATNATGMTELKEAQVARFVNPE